MIKNETLFVISKQSVVDANWLVFEENDVYKLFFPLVCVIKVVCLDDQFNGKTNFLS